MTSPNGKYAATWDKNHSEERKQIRRKYYSPRPEMTVNRRQAWTKSDDDLVLNPGGLSDRELGCKIGRTVSAIQKHRSDLLKEIAGKQ